MADQFQVRILWQSPVTLVAGRHYRLKYADSIFDASVTSLKYREDPQTLEKLSPKPIGQNDIVVANLSLAGDLDINVENLDAGAREFQLLETVTDKLLATGSFEFALYRSANIPWQELTINKSVRSGMKGQVPRCVWFTGLSGSGKSTLANLLEKRLFEQGFHTYLLDGDNLRHGLNRDLGFTETDRVENIRRVAEVAKLMVDAGLIVLASFISPFRADRSLARSLFGEAEFVEVFVNTPLAECERRDTKGLYAKARRGELKNFTGIDSAYEPPESAELVVHTQSNSPEQCVEQILIYLKGSSTR